MIPLWGYSIRDRMACSVRFSIEKGESDLTTGSTYLLFDAKESPPTSEVIKFIEDCRDQSTRMCSNAHHKVWGSAGINKRGESRL